MSTYFFFVLIWANGFLPSLAEEAKTNSTNSNATTVDVDIVNVDEAIIMSLWSTQRMIREGYGCICYLIYKPICATDGETYGNDCFLECARREDPFLLGVCNGECPCCKEPYQNKPIHVEDFEGLFPPLEGRAPYVHSLYKQQRRPLPQQNMPAKGKD